MSKTRNQRRQHDSVKKALTGIAVFFLLLAAFCLTGTRAFAMMTC